MKTILKVDQVDDKNYEVTADTGVSVAEVIFAMAVTGRALLKDGYFDSPIAIEAMFHKYLTDEEYNEMEETDDGNEETV